MDDFMQVLRTKCLKREEADGQNSHLGSANGPSSRSNIATAAATNEDHSLIICDYYQSSAHNAYHCELLILLSSDGLKNCGREIVALTTLRGDEDTRGKKASVLTDSSG